MTDPQVPADRQIARAAGVVMPAFVVSSLVGIVKLILVARVFGTEATFDSFNAANRVPDILFNLMAAGALGSAFIPVFTGFLTREDRRGAWHLASSIANLVFLFMSVAAALAWIGAPWLVERILAPGFDTDQMALTVELLRVLLPSAVLYGLSGLLMGILNAHQHFLLPAIAPTMSSLGWIFGALVLAPRMGILGLAWGVMLGAAMHLAVQLPALVGRKARYSPALGLKNPAVRQVARLIPPRLLGVAVVQLNFLVITRLASIQPEGSLSGITYGFTIMLQPQIVIAQAIAIAAFPTFSAQVARGKLGEMRVALANTLRGLIFLSLPASLGLMLLRRPVVALLFERGIFDTQSTEMVAWALLWFAAGLVGHSLVEIISRAFYAMEDTRTPALVGAAAMGLNVLLSYALAALFDHVGWMPHGGLALANSLATALESVVLLRFISRRLEGLDFKRIRRGILATAGASIAMMVVVWVWMAATAGRSVWLIGLGGVGLGAVVYWLTAMVLRAPEARQLPEYLLRKKRT